MNKDAESWNLHYTRPRSVLSYPDENLVRMLKPYLEGRDLKDLIALDLGCGSGRHLRLLNDMGVVPIGLDNTMNALNICKAFPARLIQADNCNLPFRSGSIDLIITWGSLHYCDKTHSRKQLLEIHRVMKKKGCLLGTYRSGRDTYLKRGREIESGTWITDLEDINNSIVSFFTEDELKSYLSIFGKFEYGLIERTIIGDMDKRISHWFFRAVK